MNHLDRLLKMATNPPLSNLDDVVFLDNFTEEDITKMIEKMEVYMRKPITLTEFVKLYNSKITHKRVKND